MNANNTRKPSNSKIPNINITSPEDLENEEEKQGESKIDINIDATA